MGKRIEAPLKSEMNQLGIGNKYKKRGRALAMLQRTRTGRSNESLTTASERSNPCQQGFQRLLALRLPRQNPCLVSARSAFNSAYSQVPLGTGWLPPHFTW